MDKKAKKRLAVLTKKRANLRTQIVTVRKFPDDPAELPKLEGELAKIEAEIAEIQGK